MPTRSFHPRDDFDALHGGEDTDGGGDDTVTDEEGDADEGKNADKSSRPPGLEKGDEDFPQDDRPAFPLVGEAGGEPGVFDSDEDCKRPDDQRENTQDMVVCRLRESEDHREGIDGAGADIAEDEPHSLDDAAPGGIGLPILQGDERFLHVPHIMILSVQL